MNIADPLEPQDVAATERDDRTRTRLLRSGVQVFNRKGYGAASVREIVELAGVTKPALYYHFGSKEGLLRAVLQDASQQFAAAMARSTARPGTTRERLAAMCEDLYGLFEQNVPVIRVAHAIALGPTEVVPNFDFTVFERAMVAGLEQIIQQGQASGEVSPGAPQDVALAIMGVISQIAGRKLHPLPSPTGVTELRGVLKVVFDGVFKDGTNGHVAGERQ
jgi:AcrR family transcriptional regulator